MSEIERLREIAKKAGAILAACSPISRAALMGDLRDMLDKNHAMTAGERRTTETGSKG